MSRLAYPRFIWRNYLGILIAGLVAVTLLQLLLARMVTTTELLALMPQLLEQLPGPIKAFITSQFLTSLTVSGAIGFGFNHPLVLTFFGILAIRPPLQHITTEIENGTMELLLSYPQTRTSILTQLWLAVASLLLVLALGAIAAAVNASLIYDIFSVDLLHKLFWIAANLWLFSLVIFSYSMLIAVYASESSKAGTFAVLLTLAFFILDIVTTVAPSIEWLRYVNPFYYYKPQLLMLDQRPLWEPFVVLLPTVAVLFYLAMRRFNQRDIPG